VEPILSTRFGHNVRIKHLKDLVYYEHCFSGFLAPLNTRLLSIHGRLKFVSSLWMKFYPSFQG
jgi:hypothetical protein